MTAKKTSKKSSKKSSKQNTKNISQVRYTPTKGEFRQVQKLVARYNSQRSIEMNRYKGKGYTEEELSRSAAVRPRIKGGATALIRDTVRTREDLYRMMDALNNQVKRKTSKSRPDIYVSRLEKMTGKTVSRKGLYLPRTRDDMIRKRFHDMLLSGTNISQSLIEELVGTYNPNTGELVSTGTLTEKQMTEFFIKEDKLVSEMFEFYKTEGIRDFKNIAKRVGKAMLKEGLIDRETSKKFK